MAFLQTDILFDKDKEQHPRAMAMIEQLFRELKVDARADEYHDKLKQAYPQSPYVTGAAARPAAR
jgi:outer membrane protein assembly factor BamD (BamD/ComL family)